jgi:hypothetical protein
VSLTGTISPFTTALRQTTQNVPNCDVTHIDVYNSHN